MELTQKVKVMVSQQCVFSYECSMAVLIWRLYSTICINTSSSYDDTHCWEAITLKRTFHQIFFFGWSSMFVFGEGGWENKHAILQKFRNLSMKSMRKNYLFDTRRHAPGVDGQDIKLPNSCIMARHVSGIISQQDAVDTRKLASWDGYRSPGLKNLIMLI